MLMYRCGGVVGLGTSYARSRVPPLCNSLNGCYFRLLPLLSPSSSPPPPITVGSSWKISCWYICKILKFRLCDPILFGSCNWLDWPFCPVLHFLHYSLHILPLFSLSLCSTLPLPLSSSSFFLLSLPPSPSLSLPPSSSSSSSSPQSEESSIQIDHSLQHHTSLQNANAQLDEIISSGRSTFSSLQAQYLTLKVNSLCVCVCAFGREWGGGERGREGDEAVGKRGGREGGSRDNM